MARLKNIDRPMNARPVAPGDIIMKMISLNKSSYLMVGEWPGSGRRTLMNLETGENEQVSESDLASYRLSTGIVELRNEGVI